MRTTGHLLYALLYAVAVFACVWMGHETAAQLGQGSYIWRGGHGEDLQFYHVLPLAWQAYLQQLVPLSLILGGLSTIWGACVDLTLKSMRSALQPITAYLVGAMGGLLLYIAVTSLGLFVPITSAFPLLAGTVLAMGSGAYAFSAIRQNPGWLGRAGDFALVFVSIAFSIGWSFLLMRMVE